MNTWKTWERFEKKSYNNGMKSIEDEKYEKNLERFGENYAILGGIFGFCVWKKIGFVKEEEKKKIILFGLDAFLRIFSVKLLCGLLCSLFHAATRI